MQGSRAQALDNRDMPRSAAVIDPASVSFSDAGRTRTLHLGGTAWVQGSMRVDRPFEIELEYVQRMMAWLLFVDPDRVQQRRAVQLGLGAATITKFCHQRLRMSTTAVEINPAVVQVCRQAFKLPPDDERLQVVLMDAADYLEQRGVPGSVDALQVDLFDAQAARPVLDNSDFYGACRRALCDDGVMTVNLFGRRSSFDASLACLTDLFGEACVWAFPPTREGNSIVVGTRLPMPVDRELLASRAQIIQSRWGLPADRWVRSLKRIGKVSV